MTIDAKYPADAASFVEIIKPIDGVLKPQLRFPRWPFKAPSGHVDVCQFSLAIEGPFGPVLQALARTYGDRTVSLAVFDPTPAYYRENYGSYPGLTSPASLISERIYYDATTYEPNGDPTGAVAFTANVVGITGTSGRWAVWAERGWDLAILLSDRPGGAWLSEGVDFVPLEKALNDFTEPDFNAPLPPGVREEFLRSFRTSSAANNLGSP